MDSLGIALDGGRYVRIHSKTGDFPRTVRLRTVRDGQESARLDFCVFRRDRPFIRKTHRIERLPGGADGPVELRLSLERRSWAVWTARITVPGGRREEVRIRTGIGLWPVFTAAVLLILLGLGVFLYLPAKGGFAGIGYQRNGAAEVSQRAGTAGVSDTGSGQMETDASPTEKAAPPESAGSQVPAEPTQTGTPAETAEAAAPVSAAKSPETGTGTETAGDREASVSEKQPVRIPDTVVYFAPESAVLSSRARRILDAAAETIPPDIHIVVGGHCADYGTERGRLHLSEARAETVAGYLKNRIPESVEMDVVGYGVTRPATLDAGQQDLNRRAVIAYPSDGD